jgi:hypothetical protein
LPAHVRNTLTWDQGTELAKYRQITLATKMATYVCAPTGSANEIMNGLLRQYFRKVRTCRCTHPSSCLKWPPSSTTGHDEIPDTAGRARPRSLPGPQVTARHKPEARERNPGPLRRRSTERRPRNARCWQRTVNVGVE